MRHRLSGRQHRRLRFLIVGFVAGVTVALAAVTVAAAQLPTLRSPLIVPGKSIGGLALGDTVAQAKKIWGRARCVSFPQENLIQCAMASGAVSYFAHWRNKRIYAIQITAVAPDPLDRSHLHTRRGIGIGSTKAQVLAAYPHAKVLSTRGHPCRVAVQLPHRIGFAFMCITGRLEVTVVSI